MTFTAVFVVFVIGAIFGIFISAVLTISKMSEIESQWSKAFSDLNEQYLNLRKKYYDLKEKANDGECVE